jgi:hypothetical protein
MRVDVGGDLGLERGGEHPPGTLTDQLVQQRHRAARRIVNAGLDGLRDYGEHGRTFPTDAPTSA